MNNTQNENKSVEEIQRQIILQQSKMIKDLLLKCEEYAGEKGMYESLVNRRTIRATLSCYKILERLHLTKPLRAFYALILSIKRA